ncbi:hypothetical protein BSY16_1944 [Sinorhizobium sp. RAC02]|nr:hypothetical protein BSY16_1944 [Sinorhizobium sp. RAC02]
MVWINSTARQGVPSPAASHPTSFVILGLDPRIHFVRSRQRRKLPRMPRTSARPSEEATVRATDFIAASVTVSRW